MSEYFTPILEPLPFQMFNNLNNNQQDAYLEHPEWFTQDMFFDFVINKVGEFFKVLPSRIKGTCRDRELVIPRQVAIYYCKMNSEYTLERIGKYFNRHHSTVIYSINTVNDARDTDKRFAKTLALVGESL